MLLAWAAPVLVWRLAALESRYARPWSGVARDWAPLALIPIAYWEVNWFPGAPLVSWERVWLGWDRALLDGWKMRTLVESGRGMLPSVFEAAYLFLYALPAIGMAALYALRRRDRTEQYLSTLLLGSLTAYALLPHFPTQPPRLAFPGADLPHYAGFFRGMNLWVLDHWDIRTSVFPSGHVAVAFSTAFGMMHALAGRRRLWGGFFLIAGLVFLQTIYGRYHYALDGLASMVLAALAYFVSEVWERHA
jgi:membrane-associated phospholipid phosphatase